MTQRSCGSQKTAKRVALSESESLVRQRALSVSETSSGRGGRTPNAVDKEVTRDGLRHCVTRRPGPTGRTWAPRQGALFKLRMSYLRKARRLGLALREREDCQRAVFFSNGETSRRQQEKIGFGTAGARRPPTCGFFERRDVAASTGKDGVWHCGSEKTANVRFFSNGETSRRQQETVAASNESWSLRRR